MRADRLRAGWPVLAAAGLVAALGWLRASPVEAAWTYLAAVGLYYVGWRLYRRALGDLRFLERNRRNGLRKQLAVLRVRHFGAYTLILAGYLLVGLLATLDVSAPLVGVAVLLGAEALMVLDAWQEDRTLTGFFRRTRK